jgi:anaerobic dimethyl sulfoxide reductase subunit A
MARPAMLFPGYSIQRVFAGEEPYRLTVALQIATGNFGRRGGSTGAMNSLLPGVRVGEIKVPEISGLPEVPITNWPEAILYGRAGGYPTDIHVLYNLGSNILNQGSQIHKSMAALEKLDFVVSHEIFMTPTARWCDVIFPAATPLEKEDIGIPWQGHYLLYKPQIAQPAGEARNDYDALCALANRMGFGEEFSEGRSAADWISQFIKESDVPDEDAFRRSGIYWPADPERSGLSDFAADPERFPLGTPSGKVEIASERYLQETGAPAIPTWQASPTDARYPLQLITPKSAHRTHSQGSNIPEIRRKEEHALQMHAQDAAQRGIAQGDSVRLFNGEGSARVSAHLSEDITPGVVCLLEGIWFELDADGADRAGSANMFTSTQGTHPGRACIMHGMSVEIERDQQL